MPSWVTVSERTATPAGATVACQWCGVGMEGSIVTCKRGTPSGRPDLESADRFRCITAGLQELQSAARVLFADQERITGKRVLRGVQVTDPPRDRGSSVAKEENSQKPDRVRHGQCAVIVQIRALLAGER